MKTGIRKISFLSLSSITTDYGMMPRGSSVSRSTYLPGTPTSIPFTMESADLTEQWNHNDQGSFSDVTLSFQVRADDRETVRPYIHPLCGRRAVFIVDLVNGQSFVIGSPSAPPTFTASDVVSGISQIAYNCKVALKSLHGLLSLSE